MTTETKRSTEIQDTPEKTLNHLPISSDYLDLVPDFPGDVVQYGADPDLFWIKPLYPLPYCYMTSFSKWL
jgi:hypothetical protein